MLTPQPHGPSTTPGRRYKLRVEVRLDQLDTVDRHDAVRHLDRLSRQAIARLIRYLERPLVVASLAAGSTPVRTHPAIR